MQFLVYSIFTLFFLLLLLPTSYSESDEFYVECRKTFDCGNLRHLSYPFWSDDRPQFCGYQGFKLECQDHQFPLLNIGNQDFRVVFVNPSQSMMSIVRADLFDNNICPENIAAIPPFTAGNDTLFHYEPGVENITLAYSCSLSIPYPYSFSCPGEEKPAVYGTDVILSNFGLNTTASCKATVRVPIRSSAVTEVNLNDVDYFQRVLKGGVGVDYMFDKMCDRCYESGGICGTNSTTSLFSCLCVDRPYPTMCPHAGVRNLGLKIGIGVGAGAGGVIIASVIFFIYLRRKKKTYAPSSYISQSQTSDFSSSKSDIERGGTYNGVHLFTYGELEEATNNFDSAKELGEGGFGIVYYGKLQDGRAVAVKRLYENNYRRAEQFMNEVDILTRLRHQNLVSLYGFTSRHSRELLLVYEYISNGTVADHLHGEKAKPGELRWCTRMKIATETASALAYLHAKEIIHRDVKTNNILLDNNFCVKVADFGLSRLFPLHLTHVSTAPQGTPGYVDPEYHECYQLTSKSDVYSFGVVLVELISSLPAVDITRHRHEINLSNMAINKIQSGALHELVDQSLGFQSDSAIRNMITAVAELAFQCLQSVRDLRPTMKQVLETLELILCKDYSSRTEEEADILSDDVGLLKNAPLPASPDTVMMKWTSDSSTPNTSR